MIVQNLTLNPNQIITLNDYPLHSDSVLKQYFDACLQIQPLAWVPVMQKKLVTPSFSNKTRRAFEAFEKRHPEALYFMLDGSHRTTAFTLTHQPIVTVMYETDADIKKAKKLLETGQILLNGTLDYSLSENAEILEKHFLQKPYFMTVEEKTRQMVSEKILSTEMIDVFLQK